MQEIIRRALSEELYERIGPTMEALPERYFTVHSETQIADHASAIDTLTPEYPVRVVSRDARHGRHSFTICTWDAPGLFSYISGILGARGFNIQEGEVFTGFNGLVVDSFTGIIPADTDFPRWSDALERELATLFAPLQESPPDIDAVRVTVMERVAKSYTTLSQGHHRSDDPEPLLPIRIHIDDDGTLTRVAVTSQDTPFFLYSLANALALQDMSIRQVAIETRNTEVQDTFWVEHARGGAVTGESDRRRLQLSILVTKQFSHALDQAADPRGAFIRFEELVRKVAGDGSSRRIQDLLADPAAQRELARLLGASDFLWEDFIRLQYESLLPLLQQSHARRPLSTPPSELPQKLSAALAEASGPDARKRVLNEFKDREAYLIDADHILQRDADFFFLSHRLTALAEVVVREAYRIAWDQLVQTFGTPRSVAGLTAEYAVFGLGKLGGSALGYASDIELMTVYSDHGETAGGDKTISNREFFERLVRQVDDLIETKREAIFEIDLRLRPYGDDGPKAVHVESFLDYFGPGGKAHSAERLALIRMRHIAGDAELGRRMITIRDHLIYETDAVSVLEIRELRQRQAEEKSSGHTLNAKFSPGALVDLEYNVQLLQVREGRGHRQLRNPGIHASLRALSELGTIDAAEAEGMIRAYRFLRNLINGLRMLRGNAQDLFLPGFDTLEAAHLARRMGYRDTQNQSAAEQLRIDFQVETAAVRSFVERHLGEEAIPELPAGNPADLVLSDSLSEERSALVLKSAGFRNPSRGIVNLRRIAGTGTQREVFARLLVLAWDYIVRSGDPDMALNNWDRFTEQVSDRQAFFQDLLAQPRRIEIMILIFAGSQFLSDTLIRNPGFLEWIGDPSVIVGRRYSADMQREIAAELAELPDRQARLDGIRRFRRREILRIGTKDICLAGNFTEVVEELSDLARAIVAATLEQVLSEQEGSPGRMCILAFGKLGGEELNYSSDIDLLAVYLPDPTIPDQEKAAATAFRQVVRDLSDFTVQGQAYRVDLRLRPWGNAGRLVYGVSTLERYYREEAALWELQALLKLGPIAGDQELGWELIRNLRSITTHRLERVDGEAIVSTVRQLRARAVVEHNAGPSEPGGIVGADVKNGEGGIRDIEFLVQALQMLHQRLSPEVVAANTLAALDRLEEAGILSGETVSRLREDYLFLRRIEHFLQVYDDQQLHAIPAETEAQNKLARVVMGGDGTPEDLLRHLKETLPRVRGHYLSVVERKGNSSI
jgi:[glutamine synthetase] adenylyltransferase / [glutamine synthetase]-adenylyl-L-tyrosine phosphorylase